jgi:zinc finger HIT domain-containing protein 1
MKRALENDAKPVAKRTSSRKTVVSKAMKTVDTETRIVVRDKRLAALETDNYFEEVGRESDDDDVYNESEDAKPRKKKSKLSKGGLSKWVTKKNKPLERIIDECQLTAQDSSTNGNYVSVNAAASYLPTRKFCSVCGCFGPYSCTRCGMRICSIRCGNNHKEASCLKFSF